MRPTNTALIGRHEYEISPRETRFLAICRRGRNPSRTRPECSPLLILSASPKFSQPAGRHRFEKLDLDLDIAAGRGRSS